MKKRVSRIHSFSSLTRKKGASQIGVVLAFVIFIMFLFFMFSVVEPTIKTQASKQSLLDFLRFEFTFGEFVTDSTMIMTLYNKTETGAGTGHLCLRLEDIIGIGENKIEDDFITNNNLLVKDVSEKTFNYDIHAGTNHLNIGDFEDRELRENGYFLKVYMSREVRYTNGVVSPSCFGTGDYKIGSIVEEESQVYQSGIEELKILYDVDCGLTLRDSLGVPDGSEFTFSFELADGNIIEPKQECGEPPNTNVYSTTFPMQYLDSNAELQIGFMTIKVW